MSITGINNVSGGTSGLDPAKAKSAFGNADGTGMNQFLTLLIAQLRHQDPLNPMDSANFTAQLAQFSSVEQLYGMNDKLTGIQEALSTQNQQQDLVGLIGKNVKADDNTVLIEDGKVLSGAYSLKNSADVAILIRGDDGQQVRMLYPGVNAAGEHQVAWDGRDDEGNTVADGTYYFDVSARDEYGRSVAANTYVSGEVTGLTYKYGQPYLMIQDRLISPDSQIVEISKPATAAN
ncbi:MAG: hypothetical protein KKH68_13345 [Proteobacteria bacterium]|nr:hypothetical protein [Pseudomonadota bacterium]